MLSADTIDVTTDAATRLDQATVPYVLPDGVTSVAANFTQLLTGVLDNQVYQNEYGTAINTGITVNFWSGTDSGDGSATVNNCGNWSRSDNGINGLLGSLSLLASSWKEAGLLTCDTYARLVCVEQ